MGELTGFSPDQLGIESPFLLIPQLSEKTSPQERLGDYGLSLKSPEVTTGYAPVLEKCHQLETADSRFQERTKVQEEQKSLEIITHDLNIQEAILDRDHPFYATLQAIALRISRAESDFLKKDKLFRQFFTKDYTFLITKRDRLNVFTFPTQKTTIIEGSFLILFDKFLKEVKGRSGLAQDHIAGLLAHESTHAGSKAQKGGLLKEEYCDIQALELMSQAGYNPMAMLDLEDYLVWLEEQPQLGEVGQDKEELANSFILSHPNPLNRRVIIINALEDKNRAIANLDQPFLYLPSEHLLDLSKKTSDWIETNQSRIAFLSGKEIIQALESAANLNDFFEVFLSSHHYQLARLTKELADNSRLVGNLTLMQAIFTELKARNLLPPDFYYHLPSFKRYEQIFQYRPGQHFGSFHYQKNDLFIGNLAKNLFPLEEETQDQQEKVMSKSIETQDDLTNDINSVELDISARNTTAARNISEEQLKRFEKIKSLFSYLLKEKPQITPEKLLTGDFSEDSKLSQFLKDLGIDNFHHYLSTLQNNLSQDGFNNSLKSLFSQRLQAVNYNDQLTPLLEIPPEKLTKDQVLKLIEETKYYLAASVINSLEVDRVSYPDETTKQGFASKLSQLTQKLSSVPEEQKLLYSLIADEIFGKDDPYKTEYWAELFSASMVYDENEKRLKEFSSPGLSKEMELLRINPLFGCQMLQEVIKIEDSSSFGGFLKKLAGKFDFIKCYYHQGKFVTGKNTYDFPYVFEIYPRSLREVILFREKQKRLFPTFFNQVNIKPAITDLPIESVSDSTRQVREVFQEIITLSQGIGFNNEILTETINLSEIPFADKLEFLKQLFYEGKINLNQLSQVLIKYSIANIEEYKLIIDFYKEIPVPALTRTSPFFDMYWWGNELSEHLYQSKIGLEKEKLRALEAERRAKISGKTVEEEKEKISIEEIDIFNADSQPERFKKELDFIFDFAKEGGLIGFKELSKILLFNYGAKINLFEIFSKTELPYSYLETQVKDILEKNSDRYSPYLVDQWLSLLAFSQQPKIFGLDYAGITKIIYEGKEYDTILWDEHRRFKKDFDLKTLSLTVKAFSQIPNCSYKDCALEAFYKHLKFLKNELIESKQFFKKQRDFEELEKEFLKLAIISFSPISLGINNSFRQPGLKEDVDVLKDISNRKYIPFSEQVPDDLFLGFYVYNSLASAIFSDLITGPRASYSPAFINSIFYLNYRSLDQFKKLSPDLVERNILFGRLKLLEMMPQCNLQEAMILYSLQTAYDNLPLLKNQPSFQEELSFLVNSYFNRAKSLQAKQRLFELKLRLDLNNQPITQEAVQQKFSSLDNFLNYILGHLPEKTSFRDKYLILASESFPFKVGKREEFRDLFFAGSYETDDYYVLAQRIGLEISKSIKSLSGLTKADIRGFLLWLIDERKQVKDINDFVVKFSRTSVGKAIIENILREYIPDNINLPRPRRYLNDRLRSVLLAVVPNLPQPLRKRVIRTIFKSDKVDTSDVRPIFSSGMPSVLRYQFFSYLYSLNSLITSKSVENPTVKEMFFDQMLGIKGLMDEPINLNSSSFVSRERNQFNQSQMHAFLDDLLDYAFYQGGFNKKSQRATKVCFHAFLEGLTPIRRAGVLYNLYLYLSKIDFSEPDKQTVRANFFSVALQAMGILGAKIGQIDELIPKGWGSQLSFLKSATEPMAKLRVADIFSHEGLSDEYTIKSPVGAASTACGYIVINPLGQQEFVKVIRPEARMDWRIDFKAVTHMIKCLKEAGILKTEIGPIIDQLERLVKEDLEAGREVNNVMQYVNAEAQEERKGLRIVKLPLPRIGQDRQTVTAPLNTLLVFQELFNPDDWLVLSKLKADPSLRKSKGLKSIYRLIVQDFLYRALEVGVWHSDLHEGNILVSRLGVQRRVITKDDLVLIDFGQIGTVSSSEKKVNAACLLTGLALSDKEEVSKAIFNALIDKGTHDVKTIERELSKRSGNLSKSALEVISRLKVDDYLTNFLKAVLSILPSLKSLPLKEQYELVSPYLSDELRRKFRTKLINKIFNRKKVKEK